MTRTMMAAGIAALMATTAATPADAQRKKKDEAADAAPKMKFSKKAQPLLADVQKLATAGDNAGALAKVREIEALDGLTVDDRYVANQFKINAAINTKDDALLEAALEAQLTTGKLSADEQAKYMQNVGALALKRNDNAKAIATFEKLAALKPNDADTLINVGELYQRQGRKGPAVAKINQAIAVRAAAGTPAPEQWYKRSLAIAYDGKLAAETQAASLALVGAYPTQTNWRDALVIFRDGANMDDQGNLDIMRLMKSANALSGERDFAEYAETAAQRGLPGEAKAVIDDGVAKGMLQTTKPWVKELRASVAPKVAGDRASLAGLEKQTRAGGTAKLAMATGDGYLSHGQDAKAAEMYRIALTRPGVDAATANTRLGIALARAGQKAEAEAAFRAVAGNPNRQTLATYWLAWVNRAPAGTAAPTA